MAPPHITGASFPKLHNGSGQSSSGTVTGTSGIHVNDAVHITGTGSKKWNGSVKSSAGGNAWNATVTRAGSSASAKAAKGAKATKKAKGTKSAATPMAIETVDVTVTN